MSAATPALVWWCALKQATASPDDWLYAQVDWHKAVPSMIDRKLRDVLPWCPLCRMDGGLSLRPTQDGYCGWVRLVVDPSALVVERDADGNWKLPQDTDRDKWHHGLIASVLDDLAAAARAEAST